MRRHILWDFIWIQIIANVTKNMPLASKELLFISYKFIKGFLARTFLLLVKKTLFFQTETFMMSVNVFYITRSKISAGSDKKLEISPQTPIIKIAHFCNVMSIDLTLQKWAIFIMGVYGENLCLLSDPAEMFLVI